MSAFQVVTEKVAEVIKLAAGLLAQAAAGLVNQAEKLSSEEISRRLDGALRALRGEEGSTSAGVTTAQKTSLQIAQDMVDSYAFNKKTGVSTFTVPAGVTDVQAMKALNEYFRKNHSRFVYVGDPDWYENLPKEFLAHCEQRDYSVARQITITAVVRGTKGKNRTTQGSVLEGESLVFSDPRDQALAAAIHACKNNGEDLFEGLWVRGSVPGFARYTSPYCGVGVYWYDDDIDLAYVAASGSPSPELKKT